MRASQTLSPEVCPAAPVTRGGRATAPRLERKLSLSDATALVVSNVIGVGIFTTPAVIAALVPGPGSMLALWMVGGILAFAGAVTYGELAKLCPRAGGEYNYLSHAFGPLAGFLSGWTSLIAGFSGAIAACAVALVSYLVDISRHRPRPIPSAHSPFSPPRSVYPGGAYLPRPSFCCLP